MRTLSLALMLSLAAGGTFGQEAKKAPPKGRKDAPAKADLPGKGKKSGPIGEKKTGPNAGALRNVRASLPAAVTNLPVGPVRGGLGLLPAGVRNRFGGNFLMDLGRGRILRSRAFRGDFALGLEGPGFGGKLPISGDCSAFLPVDGMAPIVQPTDPIGGDGGGDAVVPADGGPTIEGGPVVEQLQFLRVSNQTARPVRVSVAASRGRAPLVYDFRAGETNFLAVAPNRRLAASKVRIWAAGSNRTWVANQARPLDLNLAAGRGLGLRTVTYSIR